MHQCRLRNLWGLFFYSKSLVNAKAFTFEGACHCNTKVGGKKGIGFEDLDKAMKKDFIENKWYECKVQAIDSAMDNCLRVN